MLSDASEREHEVLGAIPYQRNEAVLHTDSHAAPPPPRRARRLELPPAARAQAAEHRHLLHEPPAAPARRPRLLRDAEPLGGDRPGQDHPHDRLLPSRLHARGRRRPVAARRRIGGSATRAPTSAAPTGAGAFTRTACSAPCARASRSGCRCERLGRWWASVPLRGLGPPPADGRRSRTSFATRCSWPTSTSTSCPQLLRRALAVVRAPARPGLVSALRPPRRSRRAPVAMPSTSSCGSGPGCSWRGRFGCSRTCATSASPSTPSASTTAMPTTMSKWSAVVADVTNTPWGERHAYVMAVADPADHGTVKLMRGEFDKQLHVSPLMGMDHVYDWRLTEPGEHVCSCTSSRVRRRTGQSAVRRDPLPEPPGADPERDARGRSCATRS